MQHLVPKFSKFLLPIISHSIFLCNLYIKISVHLLELISYDLGPHGYSGTHRNTLHLLKYFDMVVVYGFLLLLLDMNTPKFYGSHFIQFFRGAPLNLAAPPTFIQHLK